MRGEEFGACGLRLGGGRAEASGRDTRQLLGLEQVYLTIFKHPNYVSREVE
jgi:hypothetical protein